MEKIDLETVKRALSTVPSYSRFKPLLSKYPRMTTRADDVDERWQIDLMNVISFSPDQNDDFQYLLVIIDVFTRRIGVVPLYDKSSKEAASATELFFMTSGRIPKSITTDSGSEFVGNAFRQLCRKYGIRQYYTIPEVTHASVVERVIKTLRIKIGKYRMHFGTSRYIDVLGNIVDSYNNSVHSTIELSPNQAASSLANRQIALFNLNRNLNVAPRNKKWKRANIADGDAARIPILPLRRFRKSHEPSFSADVFNIDASEVSDKKRPFARFTREGVDQRVMKRLFFYPNELSFVYH